MHVDTDPRHNILHRIGLRAHFSEYPRKFPRSGEDVVGPLDADRYPRNGAKGLSEGNRCHEGHRRGALRRHPGPEYD